MHIVTINVELSFFFILKVVAGHCQSCYFLSLKFDFIFALGQI